MIERFVEDYAEKAYQVAYHLCGNPEDAKELVQEAFVRLIDSWEKYDQGKPLEQWFLTIMRNLYYDGARSYSRRHVVSLDAPSGEGEDSMSYAEALPDERERPLVERLERQEEGEAVQRALKSLKRTYREILVLADMQDKSYEDLARILEVPMGSVRSRLNRARAALKKAIVAEAGREVLQ